MGLDYPDAVKKASEVIGKQVEAYMRLYPTPPGQQVVDDPDQFRSAWKTLTKEQRLGILRRPGVNLDDVLNVLDHKPTQKE